MKRVAGLDLARGAACLAMIPAHAYDAYVDEPFRRTAGYAATRFVALLPLPLFMVLAGMGVALRVARGVERGEARSSVQRELATRGAQVVLSGYALNVLYGLMDGASSLAVYARFDVLHVIGASIVILGLVLPGRARPRAVSAGVGLLCLLLTPPLQRVAVGAPAGVRLLLVPFVDIAPFTQMPLFPLLSWCALGAALVDVTRAHPRRVAAVGSVVALVAYVGMEAAVSRGAPLSRAHPVVWLNALDLGARAVTVVALSLVLAPQLRTDSRALGALLTLGRGSLRVYALHLPFAYGRLGLRVRAVPDMSVLGATPWVLGVMLLTYGLLRGSDTLRDRWRAWRYTRPAT